MNKISVLLGGKTHNEQISKNNVHSVSVGGGCREEGRAGWEFPFGIRREGVSSGDAGGPLQADGTVFQTDGTSKGDHDHAAFWVYLRESRVANAKCLRRACGDMGMMIVPAISNFVLTLSEKGGC